MNPVNISGLKATQTTAGLQNSASQNETNSSGGWKYITVQEGDVVYTYIVIGKNMKILIGKTDSKDNDGDKQKQAAKDDKSTAGNTQNPLAAAGTDMKKPDFLNDLRMFALTGFYQKKCRETLEALEQQIGNEKPASPQKTAAASRDSKL